MTKPVGGQTWTDEVINSDQPVVVDFWQDGCVWCQRLSPVYDELAGEYDRAVLASIDIRDGNDNLDLARKYGIMSTPTTKVFCGGRTVGEVVGFRDKDALKEELDNIIAASSECVTNSSQVDTG